MFGKRHQGSHSATLPCIQPNQWPVNYKRNVCEYATKFMVVCWLREEIHTMLLGDALFQFFVSYRLCLLYYLEKKINPSLTVSECIWVRVWAYLEVFRFRLIGATGGRAPVVEVSDDCLSLCLIIGNKHRLLGMGTSFFICCGGMEGCLCLFWNAQRFATPGTREPLERCV